MSRLISSDGVLTEQGLAIYKLDNKEYVFKLTSSGDLAFYRYSKNKVSSEISFYISIDTLVNLPWLVDAITVYKLYPLKDIKVTRNIKIIKVIEGFAYDSFTNMQIRFIKTNKGTYYLYNTDTNLKLFDLSAKNFFQRCRITNIFRYKI